MNAKPLHDIECLPRGACFCMNGPLSLELVTPHDDRDAVKSCVECGQPARGYSEYCPDCHFDAFGGGADIG